MCSGWLNPNIAPQHFHHEVVENHVATAFGSRHPLGADSYPPAAIGMGADTVEGLTVSDAIGKAGGE
jgi:hypothetical protein